MRHAAVVLVILLLGLGAWWFASMAAGPDSVPESAEAPVFPVLGAAAMVGESPPNTTPPDEPRRAAVETKVTSVALDASALHVRVVDAATMQPVPGAEVVWYDESFVWPKYSSAIRPLERPDLEQFVRRHGQLAVADADGRLALRPRGSANLQGRSGAMYGSGQWRSVVQLETVAPFAGEFLLLLRPDRTLVVRAIDDQGQAVSNVPVQLEQTHRLTSGGTTRSLGSLPATGSDGITNLQHAQEVILAAGNVVAAVVRARISGADGSPTAIDPAALPEAPVDVLVPAFGSVLVELLGPDGAPWSLPKSAEEDVMLVPPDWAGGHLEHGINSERFDVHGRATFAHVHCGARWHLHGPTGWRNSDEFDGPTRPGEQVRVSQRLAADAVLMTGRVLRDDGTPFVDAVSLRFEGRGGESTITLPLDAEARFRIPVPAVHGTTPTIRLWQHVGFGVPRLEAEVTLRGVLVPGRNDLGDIVLREAPLLVAGQILLAGGETSLGLLDRIRLRVEHCQPGEGRQWESSSEFGVRPDADHRFVVRGAAKGRKFRLALSGDCVPQPPREFVPGTRDLRIEIASGGSVTVTFVYDPLLAWLTHQLVPTGQARGAGRERSPSLSAMVQAPRRDGEPITIHWNGLTAGAYRLLAGCQGLDPLVDLLVNVPVGGRASDPRLLDIDLRGRLRAIRVMVTDAAGTRFDGKATIVLRGRLEDGATWQGQPFDSSSGDGERFVVSQPVDLLVVAPGHRGVCVPGAFADTSVALQPAPKVTLLWVDAPTLPDGVAVSLRCSPADWPANGPSLRISRGGGFQSGPAGRGLGGENQTVGFGAGRAALTLEAPFPLQLQLRFDRDNNPTQSVTLQPAVLDPAQLGDGQTIELRADPAAVQAALQKLGAK